MHDIFGLFSCLRHLFDWLSFSWKSARQFAVTTDLEDRDPILCRHRSCKTRSHRSGNGDTPAMLVVVAIIVIVVVIIERVIAVVVVIE